MEGTIARSVGSLRANGLAARPRGEGAHFTGSGGANRKKWRKREQGKEARQGSNTSERSRPMRAQQRAQQREKRVQAGRAGGRTKRRAVWCAWRVRDDIRLKRIARMLHERGAGSTCAAGAEAWQRRAAAILQARREPISGYRAPKPSRPQLSFRDAGATVVSV
ncbi:hypothetical protein [Burkholderia cepacia]|uniref:hypothetical protein n=1 Tax=Burkholderia cepacia TaxID=292 RepID=UPI001146C42F|nr:hypothetical protein [Burkholderia cepacia]